MVSHGPSFLEMKYHIIHLTIFCCRNDIAECAKRFCDNVRDRNEKKQCWDASVYPSSIKRYAYKYKTEIPYKAFKFNYWWNFDEQKYTVDARLLGKPFLQLWWHLFEEEWIGALLHIVFALILFHLSDWIRRRRFYINC